MDEPELEEGWVKLTGKEEMETAISLQLWLSSSDVVSGWVILL